MLYYGLKRIGDTTVGLFRTNYERMIEMCPKFQVLYFSQLGFFINHFHDFGVLNQHIQLLFWIHFSSLLCFPVLYHSILACDTENASQRKFNQKKPGRQYTVQVLLYLVSVLHFFSSGLKGYSRVFRVEMNK